MKYRFEDAVERIRRVTGAKTQKELGEILGIKQPSISDAFSRKSLPPQWFLILLHKFGANPDWLAEGVGPVYLQPDKARFRDIEDPELAGPVLVPVHDTFSTEFDNGVWTPEVTKKIYLPSDLAGPDTLVVQAPDKSLEPAVYADSYVGLDTGATRFKSGSIYGLFFKRIGVILRYCYLLEDSIIEFKALQDGYPPITYNLDEASPNLVGKVRWVVQQVP